MFLIGLLSTKSWTATTVCGITQKKNSWEEKDDESWLERKFQLCKLFDIYGKFGKHVHAAFMDEILR